ncbi:beta strand repeat-containing protein, partial [Cocleimonas sp. KMM 6892]
MAFLKELQFLVFSLLAKKTNKNRAKNNFEVIQNSRINHTNGPSNNIKIRPLNSKKITALVSLFLFAFLTPNIGFAETRTLNQATAITSGMRLCDSAAEYCVDITRNSSSSLGASTVFVPGSTPTIGSTGSDVGNDELITLDYAVSASSLPFELDDIAIENIQSLTAGKSCVIGALGIEILCTYSATNIRDAYAWSAPGSWTLGTNPGGAVVSVNTGNSDNVGSFLINDPDGDNNLNLIGQFTELPADATSVLLNMKGEENGHTVGYNLDTPTSSLKMYIFNSGGGLMSWSFEPSMTITLDTTAPTVSVDIVDTELNDSDLESSVIFTFSEPTSNFDNSDITLVGGVLSNVTTSDNLTYTATFTATDGLSTTGSVTVDADSYTDASGNLGATATDSVAIDTVNPSVSVAIAESDLNDSSNISSVTFIFSEATTDFDNADIALVGGSLSAVTTSDNITYTANFTAIDGENTTGSVTVTDASYTNANGNVGTSASDTVEIDTANPSVSVDIVDTILNGADNESSVIFSFSEATTDFDNTDISVVGGTLSNVSTSDNITYTATFTATDGLSSTGSVTVNGDSYTDESGNLGVTGTDTVAIDTINPSVSVNIIDSSLNDGDNESTVTFTFSETTINFDNTDITLVGGSLSGVTTSDNITYSATFTATDGLSTTGSVTVDANSYSNGTGNLGTAGSDTVIIETINPSVSVDIVDTALNDADKESSVTFTFSEAITDFDNTDISLVGGTLSNVTTSDNINYSATFTATDDTNTTGSVTVTAGSYTNTAGNLGTTNSDTVVINTGNPSVSVDIIDANLNDADSESTVTFIFSEATTDFDNSDITVVGGNLSNVSTSNNITYTATFTATDGENTTGSVTVNESSYTSGAGNPGASGTDTVAINTSNPSVSVDVVDTELNDSDNESTVTFTFSDEITDFDNSDITLVGGSLSSVTTSDNIIYSATFTATDGLSTTGSVTVDADSYANLAGNLGATGSDTVAIDTVNPSVSVDITDTNLTDVDNESSVTFTFSEATTDFENSDITIEGGSLSILTTSDNITYSAIFTATGGTNSTGSVTVDAGSYTNAAGNLGIAGSDTVTINTTNPSVVVNIEDTDLNDTDSVSNVTFIFSEATSDFDNNDITLEGGTLSNVSTSDNINYSAIFTATDGVNTTGSVTVDAGSYTNSSGNSGTTSTDTVAIDTVNPSASVDITDSNLSDLDNESNVTFTFSEVITDFDNSDLTLVGGTLSNVSTSDNIIYTATFTATDGVNTTGSVTINAGSYTNGGGNLGTTADATVAINTANPSVNVDITDTELDDTDNISNVTFAFSEATTDFDNSDITLVGGTLSNVSTSDNVIYTAIFTATDGLSTTGTVTVNAGSYTNVGGNSGSTGTDSVSIDTANPSVTVNIEDTNLNDADLESNVTFIFSEATPDFDNSDITIVGGTLSTLTTSDNITYSATFTASDSVNTTGSVTVEADSYSDNVGNLGSTATDTVTINTENPSVSVNIVDSTLSDADNESTVVFTFSEATADFGNSDISLSGGTLSNVTTSDGITYYAVFTATDGLNTTGSVTVDADSYSNAAGNLGTAGSDNVVIDTSTDTTAPDAPTQVITVNTDGTLSISGTGDPGNT